jgi:hypothetical protein
MIDLIKMNSNGTTPEQAAAIASNNHLQRVDRNGVITHDNIHTKYADGFYMKVETNKTGRLKLECSLHKFYNHLRTGRQTNFDGFSFTNAIAAAQLLEQQTALNLNQMKVTYYEIGLNLNMTSECLTYMDKMETIGAHDSRRPLFVNPRYKGKRVKTTVFHNSIKKVYKVYDKVFEMQDKRRTDLPEHPNILRIETIYRRVERLTLADLLKPKNMQRLTSQFFRDWRTVQFTPVIAVEKGTHQIKVELCRQIMTNGEAETLNLYRIQHKKGDLTERRFRTIREFIQNEWPSFKKQIKVIKGEPEKEYLQQLTAAETALNN